MLPRVQFYLSPDTGVRDQPLEIRYANLTGAIRHKSFHALAGWTYTEGQSTLLRRVPFRDFGQPSEGAETLSPGDPECVTSAEDGSLEGRAEDTPALAEPAAGSKSTSTSSRARRRCVTCGREFRPRRPWATFCSARCRVAAHRRGKLADGRAAAAWHGEVQ